MFLTFSRTFPPEKSVCERTSGASEALSTGIGVQAELPAAGPRASKLVQSPAKAAEHL